MIADFKKTKKVAVLGYGSQGRAVALNLKDSGFNVTVGLPVKSSSRRKAKKDGISKITTTSRAVRNSDVICMALPRPPP